MEEKKFLIAPEDIKDLVKIEGYCYVSDKITVEGMKVGFMYREKPFDREDTGWRFLSGTETEVYIDNTNNVMIFAVNTVANYDPAIIPYLKSKIGTEWERVDDKFVQIKD
ncbi:MAG: DUF2185 domain-containing protein [Bacteroidales bacterium]|nr:DUF2185 domain-containing protein [Bacteroidales bacterium]